LIIVPKFRDFDRELFKKILPDDENLAKILMNHELLNVKTDEHVVVTEKVNKNFSYGYKLGKPENIGLIPNSFIKDIPKELVSKLKN